MQAPTFPTAPAVHTTFQGHQVNSAGHHLMYSRLQHMTTRLVYIGQVCVLTPGLIRGQVSLSFRCPKHMCCVPHPPSKCLKLKCCQALARCLVLLCTASP